jgi:hypothetical protein
MDLVDLLVEIRREFEQYGKGFLPLGKIPFDFFFLTVICQYLGLNFGQVIVA